MYYVLMASTSGRLHCTHQYSAADPGCLSRMSASAQRMFPAAPRPTWQRLCTSRLVEFLRATVPHRGCRQVAGELRQLLEEEEARRAWMYYDELEGGADARIDRVR